jgi:hypothetical protein
MSSSACSRKIVDMKFFCAAILLAPMLYTSCAHAEDCSRALIPDTTSENSASVQNLSIAWNMSEYSYNEARSKFGASAVIYGVPVGINYSEFRKNIQNIAQKYNYQNFEQRSFSYATSSLGTNSRDAYIACLANSGGLVVYAKAITNSYYVVAVKYAPRVDQLLLDGSLQSISNIQTGDSSIIGAEIGRMTFGAVDREFTLRPEDGNSEAAVTVRVGSTSRSLVLAPIAVPPPQPPADIVIDARDFVEGSYGIAPTTAQGNPNILWGVGIANGGPEWTTARPNHAVYALHAPKEGVYRMSILYASGGVRDVDVVVNHSSSVRALREDTGGFCIDGGHPPACPSSNAEWSSVGTFTLKEGINEFSIHRPAPFPHIKTIRFSYVQQ